MNKRMILVTPTDAEYADRYHALLDFVEVSLHDLPCGQRADRHVVASNLLKKIEEHLLELYPEFYDCI